MKALERIERYAASAGRGPARAFPPGQPREVIAALRNVDGEADNLSAHVELGTVTRSHVLVSHVLHAIRLGAGGDRSAFHNALLRAAGECLAWANEIEASLEPQPSPQIANFQKWLSTKGKR